MAILSDGITRMDRHGHPGGRLGRPTPRVRDITNHRSLDWTFPGGAIMPPPDRTRVTFEPSFQSPPWALPNRLKAAQ